MPVTNDPARAADGQLSLEVKPHPALERARRRGEHVYLQAELEAKFAIPVGRDFNPGDAFVVTVTDDRGEVLGKATLELAGKGAVKFDTIEDSHVGIIGTRRVHKATQTTE
jgi:hypothetical protein